MTQRSSCWALILIGLLASGSLLAAQRPPQRLHLVGDHWTAWDPPESFPEGSQVYTIERGDTLWDLAARFYGNPYLWPQLWEQNRYILDAHWIYPGDPLLIGFEVTEVESLAELEEAPVPPIAPEDETDLDRILAGQVPGPPVPLGSESDIYCTGYIGELNETFEFTIIGSEYESLSPAIRLQERGRIRGLYGTADTLKYGLDTGDIVYLDGGRARGLTPGTVLQVVESRQRVHHPLHGKLVGRFYRYLGRVRVLSVQAESAIAEITQACDPIVVGSRLRAFEPVPVPLARRTPLHPINFPASPERLTRGPAIILSDEGLVSMGQDHVVYIDWGAEQDVTPGDFYTIYRVSRRDVPPVVVGELAVLSVHRRTAVAKILESRHTIYVGDRLDPKL